MWRRIYFQIINARCHLTLFGHFAKKVFSVTLFLLFACTCASRSLADNPCIPNPCHNGGTCLLSEEGNFACRCPAAFSGATCQGKWHSKYRNCIWLRNFVGEEGNCTIFLNQCICFQMAELFLVIGHNWMLARCKQNRRFPVRLCDSTKLKKSASFLKTCEMAFPSMIPPDQKSIRKLTFPLSTWWSLLRMEVLSSRIRLALICKEFHSRIRTELEDYFQNSFGLNFASWRWNLTIVEYFCTTNIVMVQIP